jgi:two-component system, NtrC family, nitrogen regulation response regulator NtrX
MLEGVVKSRILVADDDPTFRRAFCRMLEMRDYSVGQASSQEETIQEVRSAKYDLLTLDLDWGSEASAGIQILRQIRLLDPSLAVVMVTGHGSVATAVEAVKLGAFDYVEKSQDRERILLTITNAVELGRVKRENEEYLGRLAGEFGLIGDSPAIKQVIYLVSRVAPTNASVLITGESGTGKGLIARQLHLMSSRKNGPFVDIDFGSVSETLAESSLFGHKRGAFTDAKEDRTGLFELADTGTVFLDEISSSSANMQKKLLRVLQEKKFSRLGENVERESDFRIIAATNRSLSTLIKTGDFREDLFYRLKQFEISLPPLRERKEDISRLTTYFLSKSSYLYGSSPKSLTYGALDVLQNHDWPGNVRELQNAVIGAAVIATGREIQADDVHQVLFGQTTPDVTTLNGLEKRTRDFRRNCIIGAISSTNGNISEAAKLLKIDRSHLHRLLNDMGLRDAK